MRGRSICCRWLLIVALSVLSLEARAEFRVFACEPEWAALVKVLMPDADITTATSYLQDPHYIEARPSLIAAMRRADLAICTGASLEAGWLPMLLQRAANPSVQVGRAGLFCASEHTRLHAPHDHVDRSMGDVHPEGNPHVHLAPDRVPEIAEALMERLRQLRPESSADVFGRYIRWRVQWSRLQETWRQKAGQLSGSSVVVQHSSFAYLLDWLGVEATVDLEPKPGLPPSAGYLAQLLSSPKLAEADAILIALHQDPSPAEWLADQTGIPVHVVPGTVTDSPETDTLGELITEIVSALGETVRSGRHGNL